MRKRDSQSYKVYRSEREAGIGNKRDWDNLDDCERFLMKVLKHRKFPYSVTKEIKVSCHGNRVHAAASRESNKLTIHLPLWARSKHVILHELAHLVIHGNLEWHGEDFCDAYLNLLRLFGNRGVAKKLYDRFIENDVRFTKGLS